MKYKIAVSGAAETKICCENAEKLAREVGKEIAKNNCVIVTGATIGIPYFSADACKKAKGISIGFSPAASKKAHVKVYHLPVDAFDIIVYTGFDYSGRNLIMTRASDAVIVICGRMGTLNEFTIAYEDHKPIGVLEGTGGTADMIRELIKFPRKRKTKVVFDKDPKKLVKKLLDVIIEEERNNHKK